MVPATAEEPSFPHSGAFLYPAQAALLTVGMVVAAYWAYQAFEKPSVALGEGPTPPRYMTQPGHYRLAVIAYVGVCLLGYGLIGYFHRDLLPLVDTVSSDLRKSIEKSTTDGSLSYPLVIVFSAWAYASLLKIERDWNPLFVFRRIVHGWVSIPEFANEIMVMMRDELVVPADARARVAADSDTPFVKIEDFEKDRQSLDRRWAELCYIRQWLSRNRAMGAHFTFFNEPSFAWEELQADYENARARIEPLKLGSVRDANVFADVAGKVETLRRRYCRLAACFLVFKNETKKNVVRDANQIGVLIPYDPSRTNPLRYIVIYIVTILVAIYLGVWLSAMTSDWVRGDRDAAFAQDPFLITRWTLYGLASYGMPILAVLILRFLGWTNDRGQPTSYLTSYAAIFLLALLISPVCLAAAVELVGSGQAAARGFPMLVFMNLQWSICPALVSVHVAYHLDRQIDPMLPDIGSVGGYWRLPQRLMFCILFGLLLTIFAALPALSISHTTSGWSVDKLRFVVVGTTFVVGLLMALVGEFLLLKPKPASSDANDKGAKDGTATTSDMSRSAA